MNAPSHLHKGFLCDTTMRNACAKSGRCVSLILLSSMWKFTLGYVWTRALLTANLCQVTQIHWTCVTLQNKTICQCYQVTTISNYLVSYDNYSNKTFRITSTLLTYRLPFTLDNNSYKVEIAGHFQLNIDVMSCWHQLATNNRSSYVKAQEQSRGHNVGKYTSVNITSDTRLNKTNVNILLLCESQTVLRYSQMQFLCITSLPKATIWERVLRITNWRYTSLRHWWP